MAKASEATIHVLARPLLTWTEDLKAIIEVWDVCSAFACLAHSCYSPKSLYNELHRGCPWLSYRCATDVAILQSTADARLSFWMMSCSQAAPEAECL